MLGYKSKGNDGLLEIVVAVFIASLLVVGVCLLGGWTLMLAMGIAYHVANSDLGFEIPAIGYRASIALTFLLTIIGAHFGGTGSFRSNRD